MVEVRKPNQSRLRAGKTENTVGILCRKIFTVGNYMWKGLEDTLLPRGRSHHPSCHLAGKRCQPPSCTSTKLMTRKRKEHHVRLLQKLMSVRSHPAATTLQGEWPPPPFCLLTLSCGASLWQGLGCTQIPSSKGGRGVGKGSLQPFSPCNTWEYGKGREGCQVSIDGF